MDVEQEHKTCSALFHSQWLGNLTPSGLFRLECYCLRLLIPAQCGGLPPLLSSGLGYILCWGVYVHVCAFSHAEKKAPNEARDLICGKKEPHFLKERKKRERILFGGK